MRAILPALKLSQFLAFFVAFIAFYSIERKFARLLPAQPKMRRFLSLLDNFGHFSVF